MTEQERLINAIFGEPADSFTIGTVVALPAWFRTTKRQRRVNIIEFVHKPGEFIVLTGILKNGKRSTDRRATIYYPLSKVSSLRRIEV